MKELPEIISNKEVNPKYEITNNLNGEIIRVYSWDTLSEEERQVVFFHELHEIEKSKRDIQLLFISVRKRLSLAENILIADITEDEVIMKMNTDEKRIYDYYMENIQSIERQMHQVHKEYKGPSWSKEQKEEFERRKNECNLSYVILRSMWQDYLNEKDESEPYIPLDSFIRKYNGDPDKLYTEYKEEAKKRKKKNRHLTILKRGE